MTASIFVRQFEYNHQTATVNLDGISHEESLIQPAPGGNCINWIVGHIAATRNTAHRLLDLPPVWADAATARYSRGSEPITGSGQAQPLDDLIERYQSSQHVLVAALQSATDEDLSRSVGGDRVAAQLAGLSFHESYHVGQLGVLRRLIGRGGAIA